MRFTKTLSLIYGFVDASGRGFGGTFEEVGQGKIDVDIGVWSSTIEEECSSN